MKKKITAIALVLCFVFLVAACGESDESSDVTTYTVGICIYRFNDRFMTQYREELQRLFLEAETETVKYNVEVVDGQDNMTTQTEQIEAFLANDVDVLIVNLVQSSSASTITEKVDAAGVKCVYINREPSADDMAASENICYVGADYRQNGTYQGEILLELKDKGDLNGDGVISYIMIKGDEDATGITRGQYTIEALENAGMQVNGLVEQSGHWDIAEGREICAAALAQYGDRVEVVLCENDGMALGAYDAILAAGRTVGEDIYLLGIDALPECVEMVRNGTMTGTVLHDYATQARAAVDAAIRYLNGEDNETYYIVDYIKITQKNAEEYLEANYAF